jgi:hypothetical protein
MLILAPSAGGKAARGPVEPFFPWPGFGGHAEARLERRAILNRDRLALDGTA